MVARRLAVALLLVAGVAALADSHVRIVRISFLARQVQVRQPVPGDNGALAPGRWTRALLNAPVIEAEDIRTQGQGEVEVQLECGSALRLAPDSEMEFPKLVLLDSGSRASTVALRHGTAYFTLRRADTVQFVAQLPAGASLTAEGAATLRIVVAADDSTNLELLDGHATVHLGKQHWDLRKDRALVLPAHGPANWVALAAPDHWELWSRGRDQAFQRALNASEPKPDLSDMLPPPPATGPPPPPGPPSPAQTAVRATDANDPFARIDGSSGVADPFFATADAIRRVPHCADN